MKKVKLSMPLLVVLFFLLVTNSAIIAQSDGGSAAPKPPMAEKKPKETKIHGETLVDDYFWLREKSNRSPIL